jgi:two-component system, cell cycle sensor histidine kinase and response regulator CckA
VRGHKGALKVYSTPGRGTAFRVLFPASEQQPQPPNATRNTESPVGSGTILVVDDEDVVRRTSKAALERFGYSVVLAENGREGVELLRDLSENIKLVLLDLTMPVMSGEEALYEIRLIRPDIKVVLSSGFNEAEAIQRFAGKKLAGFLQKPYTARLLAETVQQVLGDGQLT